MTSDAAAPAPVGLGGRRIARNTLWSLGGLVVPGLIGIVVTPAIVRGFGVERFGVLTLAWLVVGYFSLFDLGLGRAITRRVAELLAADTRDDLHEVVWTGWVIMLLLGVAGAIVGLLLSPTLVARTMEVSPGLRAETLRSFLLLALSVPVVVFTTGPRGVLEAAQRFGLVNAVRIPTGILTFLVPLATLQFTPELPPAIIGLIAVRVAGAAVYAVMALRILGSGARRPAFSRAAAVDLLGFGMWMTVSNVVSPLMVSFDRFVISALISVTAVAYYATPSELATKVMFIPSALSVVLFPVFAGGGPEARARAFRHGFQAVTLLVFPPVFVLTCFAPEVLGLWLGPDFAAQSAAVMQWMLLGILINAPGQLAFGLVQSAGRADVTAKLHVAELLPYAALLVLLLKLHGIEGAAMAWTARILVDTAFLIWYGARSSGVRLRELLPSPGVPLLLLALCAASAFAATTTMRIGLTVISAAAFFVAAWGWGGLGPLVQARVPALRHRLGRAGAARE